MAPPRWRPHRRRCELGVLLYFLHLVYGYEEVTVSQFSPKSVLPELRIQDLKLEKTDRQHIVFNLEPSIAYEDLEHQNQILEHSGDEEHQHVIVERSADPLADRESRSINMDEIPISNNNAIDDIELHNKRKYYEILPTKTLDDVVDRDFIMSSEGFGDRIDFRFPGEGFRVPKMRALQPPGPLKPTAVQQMYATASRRDGRQNAEIQNIITGIVKLLNGNVNVQANSQLLNGRPGRPMNSRINNRGPPRISDAPVPELQPATPYVPTKTPPPYPFDRPPLQVNIPEQIVPQPHRPFHRPLPPWHRPRPRPPNRRPNPNLPTYKPIAITQEIPIDLPEDEDVFTLGELELNSENNIHNSEKNESVVTSENSVPTTTDKNSQETTISEVTEVTTTQDNVTDVTKDQVNENNTTTEKNKLTTSQDNATTSQENATTSQENPTTSHDITTKEEQPETTTTTTTTTQKTEKQTNKQKTEKKKENIEKKDKVRNENRTKVETTTEILEPSEKVTLPSIAASEPTEGLPSVSTEGNGLQINVNQINSSGVDGKPLPSSQSNAYNPYRPRPGIVLDDPDFKPGGGSKRPSGSNRPGGSNRPVSIITAPDRPIGGHGEVFDVTVSAIQGPGEKGEVQIAHVNPHDDIIVSPSGDQGVVFIDGKRTYLDLFGDPTASIQPTRTRPVASSVPPNLGTGIAIPADDELPIHQHHHHQPQSPPPNPARRPPPKTHPTNSHRRPQPTVRIDTCIVGDDSTCDQMQNEKCRTEGGISSCQCRPGFARRNHRDPCRKVVAYLMDLRVDRLYDKSLPWDNKLADKESEPYQQLTYEALRAIDSAFSMTPFSDEYIGGSINSVYKGTSEQQGVYINSTILLQESPDSLRPTVSVEIQKHLLGVIRRRSNNVGASALYVDTVNGAVTAPIDVDECSSPDLNDCDDSATCTNTWGGFKCKCPSTTRDAFPSDPSRSGRKCETCPPSHCHDRGTCYLNDDQPYCTCWSGYYGWRCEMDGEVVGVAVGASLLALLVIGLTLAALLSWSRKWSREAKAVGMGSPVFNYMSHNTVKTPPVGQPPYQVTLEERMRWAQIAEAMAANHYAAESQAMATRPSSAMFGGYPTLPPVPMPRLVHNLHHTGTLNTVASRSSHHNLYGKIGYTNHAASESSSSEASTHQDRTDLIVPRPKSRARSMHNQNGIYYDVEYENAPEGIYGSKGIPLSTYTVSRGPPFYRN